MLNVQIAGVGAFVPSRCVPNDQLPEKLDTSDEWIVSHTGIKQRYIAGPEESTSSLASQAGRQALERAGVAAADLGTIIVATCTPDYAGFPSTACLVQRDLEAGTATSFDLSAGCTGFAYALEVAHSMMQRDGRPALVIGAETMSRVLDWDDRNTCVLFGDGAGAAVLTACDDPERGLRNSQLAARGEGWECLRIEGGCKESEATKPVLQMDGKPVFNFAVRVIPQVVKALMEQSGWSLDDVAWIVPHQANFRIIQAAARRLKVPTDRFFLNIERFANTSATSIPLAVNEMHEAWKLKRGDKIVTVGFGAGLTFGGNLIIW